MSNTTYETDRSVSISGAGLAGSLLAILLARRGFEVRLYERFADLRREAIPAGRSINLALAARGIRALELAGVMHSISPLLIAMPGRMLHDLNGSRTFLPYGQDASEVIYSVSRPGLNGVLLDTAESAGVQIHFNHTVRGVDFDRRRVLIHDDRADRDRKVRPLLQWSRWDAIAGRMCEHVGSACRPTASWGLGKPA